MPVNVPTLRIYVGGPVVVYRFEAPHDLVQFRPGLIARCEQLFRWLRIPGLTKFCFARFIGPIQGARPAVHPMTDDLGRWTGFLLVLVVPPSPTTGFWAQANSRIGRAIEQFCGYPSHSADHGSIARIVEDGHYPRPV